MHHALAAFELCSDINCKFASSNLTSASILETAVDKNLMPLRYCNLDTFSMFMNFIRTNRAFVMAKPLGVISISSPFKISNALWHCCFKVAYSLTNKEQMWINFYLCFDSLMRNIAGMQSSAIHVMVVVCLRAEQFFFAIPQNEQTSTLYIFK